MQPNSRFNFTKKALENLPLPENGKRFVFKDEKERGLIVRVTSSGKKTFQLYQKHQGRPIRVSLGTFPSTSVEKARKKAVDARNSFDKGQNPNVDKSRLRSELTLKELFEMYMERYSKVEKKSWIYDEREINKFLKHWFNRKISDISKNEIVNFHLKTHEQNGLYQANRILERLRSMYNKAIEWGWDGFNPTTGIKKFKEKKRERFIQPTELPFFFDALNQDENETAKDYILISLMTGARKANVLAMRWDEIDFILKKWRIPETKNGEAVTVPVIPQALQILEKRRQLTNSPWVFEGEGVKGHFADPKKSWNRIRQRATLEIWKQEKSLKTFIADVEEKLIKADNYGFTILKLFRAVQKEAEKKNILLPKGLTDVRLHDLRRTFGSYQAITGASLPIIGKTLGHKTTAATEVYARLHDDPVRESMEKAAGMMFKNFA